MKRTIITIMATLAVIVATLCMAFTMTACEKKADSYKFTVTYANGDPVNGHTDGTYGVDLETGEPLTNVYVQICAINPDDPTDSGACTDPTKIGLIGTNGKVEIKQSDLDKYGYKLKGNQKWHVALLGLKSGYTCEEFYITKGYGEYKITVTVAD